MFALCLKPFTADVDGKKTPVSLGSLLADEAVIGAGEVGKTIVPVTLRCIRKYVMPRNEAMPLTVREREDVTDIDAANYGLSRGDVLLETEHELPEGFDAVVKAAALKARPVKQSKKKKKAAPPEASADEKKPDVKKD